MKKNIARQTPGGLFVLLFFCVAGCLQTGGQAEPWAGAALSGKSAAVNIGGVALALPLPAGYAEAPAPVRQAAAEAFAPPENILGVYTPPADKGVHGKEGPKALQNRRLFIISVRPELAREAVGAAFYQAMQRDFARVNGVFSPGRIAQFKVLTGNYYARDDAFAHSLGVYATGANNMGIVRIVRRGDSVGEGAASPYAALPPDEDEKLVLAGWDTAYFARAYHQVHIQNVMSLEGRCFNIHFFAPLASEEDIYAAMRENRDYMESLAASLAGQRPAEPGGAYEAAGNFTGRRTQANPPVAAL